jgi:hypothetical protein
VVGSVWLVKGAGQRDAILSLLLMMGFFGATKVLPRDPDLVVLWIAIADRMPTLPTG